MIFMTRTKRAYNQEEDHPLHHPWKQVRGAHFGICGRHCRHSRSEVLQHPYLRKDLQRDLQMSITALVPGGVT